MDEFKYLVVEFDQDEDGPFTKKWLCATLEEAIHLTKAVTYGYTSIYELKKVY